MSADVKVYISTGFHSLRAHSCHYTRGSPSAGWGRQIFLFTAGWHRSEWVHIRGVSDVYGAAMHHVTTHSRLNETLPSIMPQRHKMMRFSDDGACFMQFQSHGPAAWSLTLTLTCIIWNYNCSINLQSCRKSFWPKLIQIHVFLLEITQAHKENCSKARRWGHTAVLRCARCCCPLQQGECVELTYTSTRALLSHTMEKPEVKTCNMLRRTLLIEKNLLSCAFIQNSKTWADQSTTRLSGTAATVWHVCSLNLNPHLLIFLIRFAHFHSS